MPYPARINPIDDGVRRKAVDQQHRRAFAFVEDLVTRGAELAPGVHPVPDAIDREVARLKLSALGVGIDELTPEQATYRDSWG